MVWLQIAAYVSLDGSSGPGEHVTTGMPASEAALSCGIMAADGMPVIAMASGLRCKADSSPPAGSVALKTRVSTVQPAAFAPASTPLPILAQIGSSHCSQKSVFPAAGGLLSGVVIVIAVGGVVTGSGADAAAADASPDVVDDPEFSELPHATNPKATNARSDMRAPRCQLFMEAP